MIRLFSRLRLAVLAAVFALPAVYAQATDYPVTVTDLAGRKVEIKSEPKRIVLQDGRDLFTLALLDRQDPLSRVVVWNNILARSDSKGWAAFEKKWPTSAAKPIDMKFGDDGQVNMEEIVAAKPDLVIVHARVKQALEDAHVLESLKSLGVPVVMIDSEMEPAVNAVKSVELLGKVLNRESEAKDYVDFYLSHQKTVNDAIAGLKKPKVFFEALAGKKGPEFCCFTHGDVYWGKLVQASGGDNLGTKMLNSRTGDVTLESIIGAEPDFYMMSGTPFADPAAVSPAFGFDADRKGIETAMAKLAARPGFSNIKAVKSGNVYGLYHQLYSSVWNIYAIEYMAKAFHPEAMKAVDPDADLNTILTKMTGLGDEKVIFGAKLDAK
ncbi:ABC transporter substrate-binding protein [Allorhizobium sp. BGMRC 0089]|uniref:ABC transporter substrate-binding protein n=1 Tax=Allorhizobium sonneratiae TaxID=2934936 RepID=UPI0020336949|nr:ABC transporter substrate-binding protein [Allorhizobium sonneratiae]MCM2292041.1 ABC transporter substrate-binding protein [Allorhizobium sonneratiae]